MSGGNGKAKKKNNFCYFSARHNDGYLTFYGDVIIFIDNSLGYSVNKEGASWKAAHDVLKSLLD